MVDFRSLKEDFIRFKERVAIWLSYWKPSKKMYDFDYTCVLEAEHHQLKRLIKCIDKYQSHVNAPRDLFWMRICDYLLDVILNDVHEDWKDGKLVLKPYCNMRNYKRYFPNISKEMIDKLEYFSHDLYVEKAWHLYHQIKEEHMRQWWD